MQGRSRRTAALRRLGALLAGVLAVLASAIPAAAHDVRVLAAGAVQGAVQRLELAVVDSGHKLLATYDTVGALRERVLAGEAADVVILSEAGMAALAAAGRIDAGTLIDLGATSVALAVRKGVEVPDVSSPDALRRTLLAAASIAHADPARGATAGAHFASVLQRLGLAEQLRDRIVVLGFGGDVIAGVAEGRFAIGPPARALCPPHALPLGQSDGRRPIGRCFPGPPDGAAGPRGASGNRLRPALA